MDSPLYRNVRWNLLYRYWLQRLELAGGAGDVVVIVLRVDVRRRPLLSYVVVVDVPVIAALVDQVARRKVEAVVGQDFNREVVEADWLLEVPATVSLLNERLLDTVVVVEV